ncbi:MAG: class II fructose-bisphosphate aldolase [Verrucomicrobia bacterium]|nr:class II fructose-bisphosphate aldolase [Verrucomicrobiota bacterium]
MSLIRCIDLLRHAHENSYAVGYFEAWDLESLLAVVRAAEVARSPVMVGFCGEYLANPQRKFKEDINLYGALARQVAQSASVPVATLLNESTDMNVAYQGVKAGFDMVMFVDEGMPIDRLTAVTHKLVEFAHACDVAVEGEVGSLGVADQSTGQQQAGHRTDPKIAAKFVAETGVDALAVSIGNIHFLEGRKVELDFELLEQLHERVSVPLVLHGGTGVDKADFRPSIERGIAKVNVGAGLKRVVIESDRRYLAESDPSRMNPNDVLGRGGRLDMNVRGQAALMDEVIGFIKAFGGEAKAS